MEKNTNPGSSTIYGISKRVIRIDNRLYSPSVEELAFRRTVMV